ncbi:hypothetical protein CspHIS471_0103870 [Cutaneotrichosporon sp. HIS471]|nr:hypothetical protein CspHIS471_0103870 [Cutaneotrichosporon sp. HIS471]
MTADITPLDICVVLQELPASDLAKVKAAFKEVHYHPDFVMPPELLPHVQFLYTAWQGLPGDLTVHDMPALQHIQLPTAGVDTALRLSSGIRELRDQGNKVKVTFANACGTHALSIPPWIVAMTVNLFHQFQVTLTVAREKQEWRKDYGIDLRGGYYTSRNLYGRTAGLIGYGAIGRETARLLKAFGMRVIAANTNGTRASDPEYVIPGTGDPDSSIPEEMYKTSDPASLDAFLRQCDVLITCVPSTPQTRWLLNRDRLRLLKKDAIFINVGRGDIIKSEDLLAALNDEEHGLFGAALDVTDPEPLPTGHPFFTHPRCIISPHLTGNAEGEFEIATDICVANAQRIREGKRPYNLVDLSKGY